MFFLSKKLRAYFYKNFARATLKAVVISLGLLLVVLGIVINNEYVLAVIAAWGVLP